MLSIDPFYVQILLGALIPGRRGAQPAAQLAHGNGRAGATGMTPGTTLEVRVHLQGLHRRAGRRAGRARPSARARSMPFWGERGRQVNSHQDRHGRPPAGRGPDPARRSAGRAPQLNEAIRAGIGVVHEERNAHHALLGRREHHLGNPPRRLGFFDEAAAGAGRPGSGELLVLDIDPRTPVSRLIGHQVQLVEIARALSLGSPRPAAGPSHLVATPAPRPSTLFRLLRRLAADGVGILFVSHKLEEVSSSATM